MVLFAVLILTILFWNKLDLLDFVHWLVLPIVRGPLSVSPHQKWMSKIYNMNSTAARSDKVWATQVDRWSEKWWCNAFDTADVTINNNNGNNSIRELVCTDSDLQPVCSRNLRMG